MLVGKGVLVGTIAAAIGVFGGAGVYVATTVGVEVLVGVSAGEFVGMSANAGAAGAGVGGQDGIQPSRQRTEGSGADGGGGADDNGEKDCEYQPTIAPPTMEIVIIPPMIAKNDPQISLNIALRLCGVFIQGGGLRNPCAANWLMNLLSRSILATPIMSTSVEHTK